MLTDERKYTDTKSCDNGVETAFASIICCTVSRKSPDIHPSRPSLFSSLTLIPKFTHVFGVELEQNATL